MKPACRLSLAALALVGVTATLTASLVRAQDKPGEAGLSFDPAMMTKMVELATPGKEHEVLTQCAGEWKQHYRMRWSPDSPWMDADGTSTAKTLLGGRYLMEETQFEMMGMPMQGLHIMGFDKNKGEHISFWADSMSTWWMTSRGKQNAEGAVDYKGTMIDVAGERPFRMVTKHRDDGSVYIEMFDTIPPHGEIKVMEITSTKKV